MLLFNLFLYDINSFTNEKITQYADGTTLFLSAKNSETLINKVEKAYLQISKYFTTNYLILKIFAIISVLRGTVYQVN